MKSIEHFCFWRRLTMFLCFWVVLKHCRCFFLSCGWYFFCFQIAFQFAKSCCTFSSLISSFKLPMSFLLLPRYVKVLTTSIWFCHIVTLNFLLRVDIILHFVTLNYIPTSPAMDLNSFFFWRFSFVTSVSEVLNVFVI